MYTNNAYLNDSHIDRKDKSNPLIVTMCGTYKLYTKPKLPTWRPRGRVDFQLLYVASGKAHFYFDKDGTDTLYMLVIWFYIAPKNLKNMSIMPRITQKYIGFTLLEAVSQIYFVPMA